MQLSWSLWSENAPWKPLVFVQVDANRKLRQGSLSKNPAGPTGGEAGVVSDHSWI
jgi:hypothetical protein